MSASIDVEPALSLIEAVGLGFVQALTEFLPVSSSGHLVLAQELFNIQSGGDAAFEVAAHLGTLLSVMILFRDELKELVKTALRPREASSESRSDLMFIIIGSIPAGLIGVSFKDAIEGAFGDLFGVGVALVCTGAFLLSTLSARGERARVSPWDALWIGLAQAVAILPGVSRSGATISLALHLGVSRERAARLSFLMSIPVVAGAGLLKALDLISQPTDPSLYLTLGVGALSAALFGLGALSLMLRWVTRPSFGYFGLYCLVVGGVAIFGAW